MTQTMHFSPRLNRADRILWRGWSRDAFDAAAREDRPVLLNITAFWCPLCHGMDETTYSDPDLIALINRELVPIRVDADRYPHVRDRYLAGGWPTNAFLTPTGEVLWAGTTPTPSEFREVAAGVLSAWRDRRPELESEIERRRRAMEAARSHRPAMGLVRREAVDEVLTAIRDAFDEQNGGFGNAPKFPYAEAIELLYAEAARTGDPAWTDRAERTLDGMLAGELWDPVDGGFFGHAYAADWTRPSYDKTLEGNAVLLSAFTLGAHLGGRPDWRDVVERTVAWADRALARPDGLWSGSLDGYEEYYRAEPARRGDVPAPAVDTALFTHRNADWIRALADAGGRLGVADWVDRALAALETLMQEMSGPDGLPYHYREPDQPPSLPGLLPGGLAVARACFAVYQATGDASFLERARQQAAALRAVLWSDEGGFLDYGHSPRDPGALRLPNRPFDLNAGAGRLFLDLAAATGERSYRAVAERILAVLSPTAGRYGVAAAEYALAVIEFFDTPLRFVVVGPRSEAEPLRRAALMVPYANRRVLHPEPDAGIAGLPSTAAGEPCVYVLGPRSRSAALRSAEELASAATAAR